jgi:hypothetical protein
MFFAMYNPAPRSPLGQAQSPHAQQLFGLFKYLFDGMTYSFQGGADMTAVAFLEQQKDKQYKQQGAGAGALQQGQGTPPAQGQRGRYSHYPSTVINNMVRARASYCIAQLAGKTAQALKVPASLILLVSLLSVFFCPGVYVCV